MIEALIGVYLEARTDSERFIDTLCRIGSEPFKTRAYQGRDRRRQTPASADVPTAKEVAHA